MPVKPIGCHATIAASGPAAPLSRLVCATGRTCAAERTDAQRRRYADDVGFIDCCPGCPYQGNAVGSRGNHASGIVLVGEAPGAKEVKDGLPFVGRAGAEVLWPAVEEAGLKEADLLVVNSVACRPFNAATPRVRKPSPIAIDACHGRFVREIGAHPRVAIVALGATAVRAVTGRRGYPVTSSALGRELPSAWGPVVPTLHPAYVLRRGRGGPEHRRLVEDLKHARRLASGAGE